MNILIWLVVGGLAGWVSSVIMPTAAPGWVLVNVAVGIIGAALAGSVASPIVGVIQAVDENNFSTLELLVPLLGAAILLWIENLIRQRVAR